MGNDGLGNFLRLLHNSFCCLQVSSLVLGVTFCNIENLNFAAFDVESET